VCISKCGTLHVMKLVVSNRTPPVLRQYCAPLVSLLAQRCYEVTRRWTFSQQKASIGDDHALSVCGAVRRQRTSALASRMCPAINMRNSKNRLCRYSCFCCFVFFFCFFFVNLVACVETRYSKQVIFPG
jgi:hypothetical protein